MSMPQPWPCTSGTTPSMFGIIVQDAGRLTSSRDEPGHRGRAVHAGQDAEIVAGADLAVGAAEALEGRAARSTGTDVAGIAALRELRSRGRTPCIAMPILCSCTQSPGAMSWVAKPMIWPNFSDRLAGGDRLRCHLVAERHALARDDALRHELLVDPLAGHQDVVFRAEAQHARNCVRDHDVLVSG